MTELSKPRKKRRRLKKSVRRGCLGIVLTALLFIVLSVYDCRRDTRQAGIPLVVQPDSLPDTRDSVLAQRLARVVARTPRIDSAHVGLMVYDLTHRSEIFHHHSNELMTPASCQKLLTALSAIRRLGIGHSYVSRPFACQRRGVRQHAARNADSLDGRRSAHRLV